MSGRNVALGEVQFVVCTLGKIDSVGQLETGRTGHTILVCQICTKA